MKFNPEINPSCSATFLHGVRLPSDPHAYAERVREIVRAEHLAKELGLATLDWALEMRPVPLETNLSSEEGEK